MSLSIKRTRNAVAGVNWTLVSAVALTLFTVVLLVLWSIWLVAGDPTVHSYVEHTLLIRTSDFHGGSVATNLHNGWTALAFGDQVASSFPWLAVLSPFVIIVSAGAAAMCYRANNYDWRS